MVNLLFKKHQDMHISYLIVSYLPDTIWYHIAKIYSIPSIVLCIGAPTVYICNECVSTA